jgi:Fe2+ or Zn2+ uptake regulation protein
MILLLGIEDGKVVGMALQRQLVGSSDLSTVYDIMEKLTGSSLIRKAAIGDAYAMITIKGTNEITQL